MLGIYLHIPFCASKCWYCDFNSHAGLDWLAPAYVGALCEEIGRAPASLEATSIFVGGGTPSRLPPPLLRELLDACRTRFQLADDVEVTLEANPESSTLAGFAAAREAGIGRVSIGVQAFDPALLRRLGRAHDPAQAVAAFAAARAAGIGQVNLDLMYGLPGQGLGSWEETLRKALALEPDHLSLYALIVEEDTPFGAAQRAGRLGLLPDDLVADQHELAADLLDRAGYERYEISNWYHRGHGRPCRHNLTYWRNEPYLGFGAGAHSSFGGRRYANVRPPVEYARRVRAGLPLVDCEEWLSRATDVADTVILALRLTEGLRFQRFRERYGVDVRHLYAGTIRELQEVGVLEVDEERMRVAPRSLFVSSDIMARFLPTDEPASEVHAA